MAVSKGFLDGIADMLHPLGTISTRKMFGGAALYCDGQVFAIVSDDVMYLKVDDKTRPAFVTEGCGPFIYAMPNGVQSMASYHKAPDRLLDDVDDMRSWVRDAVAVGRRAAKAPMADKVAKAPKSKPASKGRVR
jgi:DNA transformation protein and related proteins